jgi:hypothetical protein
VSPSLAGTIGGCFITEGKITRKAQPGWSRLAAFTGKVGRCDA